MTIREATDLLLRIEEALRLTYPDAFKTIPGSATLMPRFGWEVRLASATKKLAATAIQLRSTVQEADPHELLGHVDYEIDKQREKRVTALEARK